MMAAVNLDMVDFLEKNPGAGLHMRNPMPVEMLEVPGDINANAVAFLASDEARWVTGVTLPVDAGFCNKL